VCVCVRVRMCTHACVCTCVYAQPSAHLFICSDTGVLFAIVRKNIWHIKFAYLLKLFLFNAQGLKWNCYTLFCSIISAQQIQEDCQRGKGQTDSDGFISREQNPLVP